MNHIKSRRDFLRDVGVSAAAMPFITNLPSLSFVEKGLRKKRLVIMFSPDGIVPSTFWPDAEGADFAFKEILKPLEPYKDKTLMLKGLSTKIRGDGDGHMRGIGCFRATCKEDQIPPPDGQAEFLLTKRFGIICRNRFSRARATARSNLE